MKNGFSILAALIVAIGLTTSGWFVGNGFTKGRSADRFVTVKGVSERHVKADIALWPLRFVATDDDLGQAQKKVESSNKVIVRFLEKYGIEASKAELQTLEVTDILTNPYRSGPTTSRFIVNQTLMVRSEEPELIRAASQKVGELVDAEMRSEEGWVRNNERSQDIEGEIGDVLFMLVVYARNRNIDPIAAMYKKMRSKGWEKSN